ncbi:conserved hypothetical protein [Culex quinquefasciatus]|uniref:Uncharacterized protein n=1 Tax=Culex quinquefasciatus TaxID=7176 RepID=B0WG72_CULQU|nr:conserved hypothetical protein [Culex quinquefasciatus]|eukprot:XP_001847706.1 conserved hypothetical protein [Culex quinquefasciatus]
MSSRTSSAVSTDSYPSLYRSFGSKSSTSTHLASSSDSSKPSSASSSTSVSTIPNHPKVTTSYSTIPPKLHWNREAQLAGRPYELRDLDRPYKPLQPYLSELGGLEVPPRKPCQPHKPDPFHRRTYPDEIFHKRVTDASTFSITERPRSRACPPAKEEPLDSLRGVLLADNVDSDGGSSSTDESEDLSEMSWHAFQAKPEKDAVLRECKRSFFRARRELFKLRQYEDYVAEKNRKPVELESWEISSESTVVEGEEEVQVEEEEELIEESTDVDEYQTTVILREDDKQRTQDHKAEHLEQVRERMWAGYEKAEREEEEQRALRALSPPPLDEEEMMRNVPEQDYLNKQKWLDREAIAKRLEEIKRSQQRIPRKLPQTAVQFEKYTDELMKARRELRDEAVLVDDHYRKAGIEVSVPEKDLQLRKFRAADHKSDASESEDYEGSDAPKEEPVVHTCMTRFEWSRWMGTSTKMEKLKLPKVKIPRMPRLIHEAKQSPIRRYIRGQIDEKETEEPTPDKNAFISKKKKPKSVGWRLLDVLYDDKPLEHRISKFVPYKPPVRPFTELSKDSFKQRQAGRRTRRELRKNHMSWIDALVDEICAKN